MSDLGFLEKLLDGAQVEWKSLGDLGNFIRGNGLQKNDLMDEGLPAIHYGQIYTRYGLEARETYSQVPANLFDKLRQAKANDLLLATTSETDEDVVKPLAWYGADVAISGDMMIFRHSQNAKYLAYFVLTEAFQKQKRKYITGTKVRRVSSADLAKIEVPIPCPKDPEKSLAIQGEIVRILDSFAELTAELTAELAARKKQYNHYRDQLLGYDVEGLELKPLGWVGEVRMCKRVLKGQTSSTGDIPFFKIGTFGKQADAFIPRDLFEQFRHRYSYPKIGEVLISASGTLGRAVIFDGEEAYFQDSNIVWLENDETKVLNKYLFYFYQIAKWYVSDGGVIKRLYNDNIKRTLIPVPCPDEREKSLAEQTRIVSILDKFDTLTTSHSEGLPREIELRQKQYEYYRDLLLSFPKTAEAAEA